MTTEALAKLEGRSPKLIDDIAVLRVASAVLRLRRVDAERAHLVASAFVAASSAATDPKVRAAYAALSDQAGLWFGRLTSDWSRRPVRVAFTRCHEPYADAAELSQSVRRHRILEIFAAGHDRDRRHPLLDTSIGGSYDRFRAVHDIVSHGFLRYPFDRHGEFSAWRAEHRIYTGLARWALATELHGEHSVLWTSGELADHKAVLLDPGLLKAALPGMRARLPTSSRGSCRPLAANPRQQPRRGSP